MLGAMNARLTMTYAEYLAREATAEVKHEFIAGEVFEWCAPATALAHGLSGRPFQLLRDASRCSVETSAASGNCTSSDPVSTSS